MEIRTTILATSKENFAANLTVEINKSINSILECEEPKIMTIQFRNAEEEETARRKVNGEEEQ